MSELTHTHTALEYIRHVHQERDEREQKMDTLKKEIEQLTTTIARCQEQLPASGVPVTRQVCVCVCVRAMKG